MIDDLKNKSLSGNGLNTLKRLLERLEPPYHVLHLQ